MIKLKIGDKSIKVNGTHKSIDVAPFLKDRRTFVPVRFVSEALGYNVEWNDKTKEVTIYGRKKYFDTIEDCAYDWAMHFNAPSIALFKEFAGIIFEHDDGYFWDRLMIGRDKEVNITAPDIRKGVAFIHSHSGGKPSMTNTMTKADKDLANAAKRPCYMVDSGGCLHVYDGASTDRQAKQQKMVRDGLPVDGKYVDMTASVENMRKYFKNYHDLSEYEIGYIADFYNKVYMMGKKYTDIQECKNL